MKEIPEATHKIRFYTLVVILATFLLILSLSGKAECRGVSSSLASVVEKSMAFSSGIPFAVVAVWLIVWGKRDVSRAKGS
jgi:protein-S-isoprenylcysteine O-methyltransferase Ste14